MFAALLGCSAAVSVYYPYSGYNGLGYGYGGYGGYGYHQVAPQYVYQQQQQVVPVTHQVPQVQQVVPVTYQVPQVQVPQVQSSQFHAQDEFGNLQYGYNNLNSVKHEVGNTYGGVSGTYSYVDAHGLLQKVEYVADGLGFRVADSRLPVAPEFNPEPLVAPVDTVEVAEAKIAHQKAMEAALAAATEADVMES